VAVTTPSRGQRVRRYLAAVGVTSLVAVTTWGLARAAGLPAALAVGAALLAALAVWPAPWPRPARDAPPPAPPRPARTLALGRVARAPALAGGVTVGQPFTLSLDELAHHVSILGVTGSGKTTTLSRIMDHALAAGWPVAVVDAKGGGLARTARSLALRHDVPARVWLPGDEDSWTYDVCSGEPAAIANRLIGAFDHGPDAEVYRQISQAVLPLVLRALRSAGQPCDLEAVRSHLDRPRLVGLARRVPDDALRSELLGMLDDPLHKKALAGLVGRLGALHNGAFGPWLLPSARTLDLGQALTTRGVTYLGLPATGASEDVALVGRVFVQELKQVTHTLLAAATTSPALIVVDEFATLREAGQLVDLLLQSREARLSLVVSSQYLPRLPALRNALLGSGVLVVHQVGSAEEADLLARTLGTRAAVEVSQQIVGSSPGRRTHSRTLRGGLAYLAPPDELQRLAIGQAVVSVRHGEQRLAVVDVTPLPS